MSEQQSLISALKALDAIAYDWRSRLILAVQTDNHEELDIVYERWYKKLEETIARVHAAAEGELAYLERLVEQWKSIPLCVGADDETLYIIDEQRCNCLAQIENVVSQIKGGE